MYHLNPDIRVRDNHDDVWDPHAWNVKVKTQSAVYPPLVWQEKLPHTGISAVVRSSRFRDFPMLAFMFPPMSFTTHQMDACPEGEWTMLIRQKRVESRVRIKFFNREKFGFRIRIKGGRYDTIEDVFLEAQKSFVIEEDEAGLYRTKPAKQFVDRPVYITELGSDLVAIHGEKEAQEILRSIAIRDIPGMIDFDKILADENAKALARLGDWRPGKDDMTNVVRIEDYMDRVENDEIGHNEPIDLQQLIEKLA